MKRSSGDWFLILALALAAIAVVVGTLVPGAGRWLPFYAPMATHLVAFALVGLLARFAMAGSPHAMPGALLLAAGLGSALETLQLVVPKRTFALVDLFANVAGSIFGVLLAGLVLAALGRRRGGCSGHAQATEPD